MHHVVLDTNIYRQDPSRKKLDFQALEKLADANILLAKRIKDLENPKTHQPTYNEIKKMNWWQFRKFKRQN